MILPSRAERVKLMRRMAGWAISAAERLSTVPAGHDRYHDMIAGLNAGDLAAHGLDNGSAFVPENNVKRRRPTPPCRYDRCQWQPSA
jgi:hypothetical protein